MEQERMEGVRLLVVDDNEVNLTIIKRLLKDTGAQIDTTLSGKDGVSKAAGNVYDCILLDHMMPEMDGVETLRRLQRLDTVRRQVTPVIALTANASDDAREEYLQYGFTDYLAKPVYYGTLIAMLEKYLPGRLIKYPEEKGVQLPGEAYLEEKGIHVKASMKYAGDDVNQYIQMLRLFVSDLGLEKQAEILHAHNTQNWKDYTTYVHGFKNVARTLGADALADVAYEHEWNSKEGNITFVQTHLQELVQEYHKTRDIIISYFHIYGKDTDDEKMVIGKKALPEAEWKETTEQTIRCLKQYKKKEALSLLDKLLQSSPAGEREETLKQAIYAVQEYDYEQAVHILRKD